MGLIAIISLASALAATSNPTCKRLSSELVELEKLWGSTHDLSQAFIDSQREFADAVAQSGHRDAGDEAKLRQMRQDLAQEDRDWAGKADRIITAMVANKCTPPDRVPNWFTYSSANPNRPASSNAKKDAN